MKTAAARRYHGEKWICKLKTLAPLGLNTEIGDYAKECTISTNSKSVISFDIMFTW